LLGQEEGATAGRRWVWPCGLVDVTRAVDLLALPRPPAFICRGAALRCAGGPGPFRWGNACGGCVRCTHAGGRAAAAARAQLRRPSVCLEDGPPSLVVPAGPFRAYLAAIPTNLTGREANKSGADGSNGTDHHHRKKKRRKNRGVLALARNFPEGESAVRDRTPIMHPSKRTRFVAPRRLAPIQKCIYLPAVPVCQRLADDAATSLPLGPPLRPLTTTQWNDDDRSRHARCTTRVLLILTPSPGVCQSASR
jgi:hypothetical protein